MKRGGGMEQAGRDRKVILQMLRRMLRSRPNDAVKLAFLGENEASAVDDLDLTMLAEFKRSANGAAEVKLRDRLELLELLERLSAPEDGESAGAERFFRALEARAGGEKEHDP